MRQWTEEVPTWIIKIALPPLEMAKSRNQGQHWASKSAAVRAYRDDCALCFQQGFADAIHRTAPSVTLPLARITISYRLFCGPSHGYGYKDGLHRPQDADNAICALYPCQDALVDAGIIKDDKFEYVRIGSVVGFKEGDPWVEVTIKEWLPDDDPRGNGINLDDIEAVQLHLDRLKARAIR